MSVTRPTRTAGRLVGLAVAVLPAPQRGRYARELYAELYGMTPLAQLRHAGGLLLHSWALRSALVDTHQEETVMTTTAKPLRCRLGLHRWDERENPETHERYQICERCDAYHERPRAAAGTGAASTTNGGMF